jgi:hypothetical protein
MSKSIFYSALLILVTSCEFLGSGTPTKSSKVVARVHDAKLHQEDMQGLFSENLSYEDSIVLTRNFINSWAKQQLLFRKSKVNMPTENNAMEALVAKYRQDLFINTFKEALIKQKLDTVVLKQQLLSCYESNKESFKLNEVLIQFKFVKISKKQKDRNRWKRLLRSNKPADLHLLAESEAQFQDSFLNDSVWVSYKKVAEELPILGGFKVPSWVRPNAFFQKSDSEGLYYIHIKELRTKNEIAPLEYIEETLQEMILHQRKLKLVHTIEDVLVDDAIKNKQFEIY